MMSYITDLETVDEVSESKVEVSGHDMQSLLYNFMDEFLFQVFPPLCGTNAHPSTEKCTATKQDPTPSRLDT